MGYAGRRNYSLPFQTLEDKEKITNIILKVPTPFFPLNTYDSISGVFTQTLSFFGTKHTRSYVLVYYLEINKSDLPQAWHIIRLTGQQEGIISPQAADMLAVVGMTCQSIDASCVKSCLDWIIKDNLDSVQTKPALHGQLVVTSKGESENDHKTVLPPKLFYICWHRTSSMNSTIAPSFGR